MCLHRPEHLSPDSSPSAPRLTARSRPEGQLIEQIHEVSKIASVKMRRVRRAFLLSAPATALWLVLLVWGTIRLNSGLLDMDPVG